MEEYVKGADFIRQRGFNQKPAREGMVGTKACSNLQLRFKLNSVIGEVPILTTKKVSFKNVMVELLWFLKGQDNIKYLVDNNCNIWNDNAYKWFVKLNKEEQLGYPNWTKEEFIDNIRNCSHREIRQQGICRPNGIDYKPGDNGFIYGYQWRKRKVDQLQRNIDMLINQPSSRQNKTCAWVTEDMNYEFVSQPNCHGDFVITGKELSTDARINLLKKKVKSDGINIDLRELGDLLVNHSIPKSSFTLSLYQRSGDYALGIPYNITSYAMLAYILGIVSNTIPTFLALTIADAHVYNDHANGLKAQCQRKPLPLPTFKLKGKTFEEWIFDGRYYNNLDKFLDDVEVGDFELVDYNNHGSANYKLHTGNINKQKSKKK